ncbi:hypothetical protein HELRODRAFT_191663 [Helobdella robusta]|uniref:Uncharacterized protein n=1 Tax=Helobdella robusta TaxID=6412 RepID=T1FT70_HELRO|nr:hypothetical protein HELRODRAFT_191663 [Helobdella robusta]ESO04640.1 hypothetical protein HELRODRAFT_191663 [Helobdella robusta]
MNEYFSSRSMGISSDFEALCERFRSLHSISYADFLKVWTDMHFDCLFSGRINDRECREFTEECMKLVSIFLNPVQPFSIRVCSIYLFYALYHTHPFQPKVKVRLTLQEWEDLLMFVDDVKHRANQLYTQHRERNAILINDEEANDVINVSGYNDNNNINDDIINIDDDDDVRNKIVGVVKTDDDDNNNINDDSNRKVNVVGDCIKNHSNNNIYNINNNNNIDDDNIDLISSVVRGYDNIISNNNNNNNNINNSNNNNNISDNYDNNVNLNKNENAYTGIDNNNVARYSDNDNMNNSDKNSKNINNNINNNNNNSNSNSLSVNQYSDVLYAFNCLRRLKAFQFVAFKTELHSSMRLSGEVYNDAEQQKIDFLIKRPSAVSKIFNSDAIDEMSAIAEEYSRHKQLICDTIFNDPSLRVVDNTIVQNITRMVTSHDDWKKNKSLKKIRKRLDSGSHVTSDSEVESEADQTSRGSTPVKEPLKTRGDIRSEIKAKAFSSTATIAKYNQQRYKGTPRKTFPSGTALDVSDGGLTNRTNTNNISASNGKTKNKKKSNNASNINDDDDDGDDDDDDGDDDVEISLIEINKRSGKGKNVSNGKSKGKKNNINSNNGNDKTKPKLKTSKKKQKKPKKDASFKDDGDDYYHDVDDEDDNDCLIEITPSKTSFKRKRGPSMAFEASAPKNSKRTGVNMRLPSAKSKVRTATKGTTASTATNSNDDNRQINNKNNNNDDDDDDFIEDDDGDIVVIEEALMKK